MASPSQTQKSPFRSLLGSTSPQLHFHTPNATRSSQKSTPKPGTILTPELCDRLSTSIAPSETDGPLITPFLRRAQEELAAYKSALTQENSDDNGLALVQGSPGKNDENALAMVLHTQENNNDENVTLAVVQNPQDGAPMKRGAKQLKKKTKELSRAEISTPEDTVKARSSVRRARIAYDSLRLHYHHKFWTDPHAREATKMDRSDMKAFSELHKLGSKLLPYIQADKRIVGSIPGIEIGDVFFFRAELCLLGLHGPTQAGIGYAPRVFVEENEPIAISIVDSDGYEYNRELGEEVLLYTGSGGKGRNDSQVVADQSLERGNLALERSMTYGIEVRVIRGMPLTPHSSQKVYVYDGLFRVIECIPSQGESGCRVYQFKLLHIQGQCQLGSKTVRIAAETKAKLDMGIVPSGYVTRDISNKKEALPVLFYNDVDKKGEPMMYNPNVCEYLKSSEYPPSSKQSAMKGCKCRSTCSDECSCKARNDGTFPYSNGVLLQGRPVIYECGDGCHCPATCSNRVCQKGIRYQLEVFRSADTQFGLRSLEPIQAGTFICEFRGDVILRESVTPGSEYEALLIDPVKFPPRWQNWGDLTAVFPAWKPTESPALKKQPGYFLDVSIRNNVASYITHSEDPNAFIQLVLYPHDNFQFPRMAVFAMENIPSLRGITLDYGDCSSVPDCGEFLLRGE